MAKNFSTSVPHIDQLIRSNRRSIGLEVHPDGRLVVRAPRYASVKEIEEVVKNKQKWIEKSRARLSRRSPAYKPKTFTAGETFWYLGEQYPLQLADRTRPLLVLDGCFSLSKNTQLNAKDVFVEWYREETRQITTDIIQDYSRIHGFRVNQVRVTSARTRWGSCSGKNNLNFTYRLCMAPFSVVTYVVVHELVHLNIRNHSKAFWREVEAIKPDYKGDREWLKQSGHLLRLD